MTEEQFRDLIERHHRISALAEHPDYQLLADYITAETAAKHRWLLGGYAKTLEEYQAAAGWIQGAQFFLAAPDRLNEQIQRERERMEQERQAQAEAEAV